MKKCNRFGMLMTMVLCAWALAVPMAGAQPKPYPVTDADLAKIQAALPAQAPAAPAAPRRVLVFDRVEGFPHPVVELASKTFQMMGEKSGAFTADVSSDMAVFTPANLAKYDAVLFNNTTQLKFEDPAQRAALLDFVRGGKGVIGIHAASDNFPTWPEGAAMIGGVFDGHPWGADGVVAVKLDEPDHPLNAAFGGEGFNVSDEIYQFQQPYSREKSRVLVSLDMTNPINDKPGQKRADKDYAISWIHREGEGRVFFCSFGHNPEIFWNANILGHYLAGIQYALGDLKADDTPSAQLRRQPEPARTMRVIDPGQPVSLLEDGVMDLWQQPQGDWLMAASVYPQKDNAELLEWEPGTAIVMNGSNGKTGDLRTVFPMGDVDASFEFMTPKGAAPAVYFMGRYPLPFGDAAIEPAQWQQCDVIFQAPRLDAAGAVTEEARFVKVSLNGKMVAENAIATPAADSGGAVTKEASFFGVQATVTSVADGYTDGMALAPLRLRGDQGPVAYRDFVIRPMKGFMTLPISATEQALRALPAYQFELGNADLRQINEAIRVNKPQANAELEVRLLAIATDSNATMQGRQYACEMLRRIGGKRTVAGLAPLLGDPAMSNAARYAIERIGGSKAERAVRQAAAEANGPTLTGLINSLGELRDGSAVGMLADEAKNRDATVAEAAVAALGAVGTRKAAGELNSIRISRSLSVALADARLRCARALMQTERPLWRSILGKVFLVDFIRDSNAEVAADMLKDLAKPNKPAAVRVAALRAQMRMQGPAFAETAVDLIGGNDPILSQAARQFVIELPGGTEGTRALADAFLARKDRFSTASTAMMLESFKLRGDGAAREAVNALRESENKAVQVAAIEALATVGNAEDVPFLLHLVDPDSPEGKASYMTLVVMPGVPVEDALIARIPKAEPAGVECILELLANRRAKMALPTLVEQAASDNEGIRVAALKALGPLSGAEQIPLLTEAVANAKSEAVRKAARESLSVAIQGLDQPGEGVGVVTGVMATASPEAKIDLLRVLGLVGNAEALAAVQGELKNSNAEVADAALRTLADWRDPAALPVLENLAIEAGQPVQRILALRGYIRLAGDEQAGDPGARLDLYRKAMQMSSRPDEQRLVLAGLQKLGTVPALDMVAKQLDVPAINGEAAQAIFKMLEDAKSPAGKQGAKARPILQKIAETSKDAETVKKAQEALAKLPAADAGQ